MDSNGNSIDVCSLLWAQLISAADAGLAHDLWVAAIRTIASKLINKSLAIDDDLVDIDIECRDWLLKCVPRDTELARILDDQGFFYDMDISWDEIIALSGVAYGADPNGPVGLNEYIVHPWDRSPDISVVEEHWREWRLNFLRFVVEQGKRARGGG